MDLIFEGGTIEEGDFEQEGAIWSPAKVAKDADGNFHLFLGTLLVDESNIATASPWTLMDKSGAIPEGTPFSSK